MTHIPKPFVPRLLISMLIVSWANNRASLFFKPPPPSVSLPTHTHTRCTLSCPLPLRSGIILTYLDERLPALSSLVDVFVVLSQTVWLHAVEFRAPHGPGALLHGRTEGEFSRVIQSSRKGLRGFVHI